MTKQHYFKTTILCATLAATGLLTACFHDDDNDDDMETPKLSYQITVSNLTNGQAFTPPAVILHDGDYHAWHAGMTASIGLEKLAEGGDVSEFLDMAAASSHVSATMASANGPFGPGASETLTVMVAQSDKLRLSLATMLANTNDAFTGISEADIGELAVGESMVVMAPAYDAGTEANTEASGTIPGPADTTVGGGEGYNAATETGRVVTIHPGIVSMDDGLSTSILSEAHRWQNPVAKITIERLQ